MGMAYIEDVKDVSKTNAIDLGKIQANHLK